MEPKKSTAYQTELSNSLKFLNWEDNTSSIDENIADLKNIIYDFANQNKISRDKFQPKNKWFDRQCQNARTQMLKSLKLCRKHDNIVEYRTTYLDKVKTYKKTCQEKEKLYKYNQALRLSKVKDSKGWWSVAKEFQPTKFTMGINIQVQDLATYFKGVYNPLNEKPSIQYAEPYVETEILDAEFTIEELNRVLRKAKDCRAPGMDRIPYEYYKNANQQFLEKLCQIMNEVFQTASTPQTYRKSIIFSIFNKKEIKMK